MFDYLRPEWMEQARCKGADPSVFFPDRRESHSNVGAIVSLFCEQCPVQKECLKHALDTKENTGIWGGTTGRQRRTMRTGKTQAHCAWCGKTFQYPTDSRRQYCSPECNAAGRARTKRVKARAARAGAVYG